MRKEDVTVHEHDVLAEQFELHRAHLRAVAYRMLGSRSEADDAVQESWLRLSRSSTSGIDNLGGWLTTVVARVCLDLLRSRKSRREELLDANMLEPITSRAGGIDPEQEALLTDSVGLALLVVLETLAPAERLAFVLHDVFSVPFDEISPIVGRSPVAARQLASRARRRVRGADAVAETDLTRQREVVDAFLAASRNGNFEGLLAVLDPHVLLRADDAAVQAAAPNQAKGAPKLATEVRGAVSVADAFSGRARFSQPARINGAVGAVWATNGTPRAIFQFVIAGGKIVGIDIIVDPGHISRLDLVMLDD